MLQSEKHGTAMYALLSAIYMLPYLQAVSTGVISLPLAQEGLTADQVALVASTYLGGYALVQLFAGMLAARFGPRLTLGFFLGLSACGSLLFAAAGKLPGALPMALAGRLFCGMGMAVVLTSALTIFVRWFSPQTYGRLCGWFFCFGGLGAILGTALMAVLCGQWGWRGIYAGLGCVTLLGAAASLMLIRDYPPNAGAQPANNSLHALLHAVAQAARKFNFWRIAGWFFFISSIYYGFFALWGGPWLAEVHHFDAGRVGGILSMGALGFVFGSPAFTWYCEHAVCSHKIGLVASCAAALVCMGAIILVGDSLHVFWLYALALGLGMACNAPNAIAYAASRALFGDAIAGSLAGIFGFCSFLGGMFLQGLGGIIISRARIFCGDGAQFFQLAFIPFVLFAALGLALLAGLPETCRKAGT